MAEAEGMEKDGLTALLKKPLQILQSASVPVMLSAASTGGQPLSSGAEHKSN